MVILNVINKIGGYVVGKNKLKLISIHLIITIILLSTNIVFSEENFDINAKSALLMDFNTGEIVYEKNPHERLAPASVSKIMVLLIAMENLEDGNINLNDEVVISNNAANMGGSQVFLEEGEIQKVDDLIRAICLRSANDASVALGEYISGSESAFLELMNKRAKELEMNNTNFANSTGLPNDNHYTSAYDIGIMSRELLRYPKIHDWLTPWMAEMKVAKDKNVIQSLVNTNRLIKDYEGANGIKTGSTQEAGFCLSGSAKRGNLQLISVVLGCENSKVRFEESKNLLDYGFENYNSITIGKKGDVISKIKVNKGNEEFANLVLERDSFVLTPKATSSNVEKEILIPEFMDAPLEPGQAIGEMILKINGKTIDKINLVCEKKIEKANISNMIKKIIRLY